MPIVLNGTTGITTPDITAPTTTLSSLNSGQLAGMRNKIISGVEAQIAALRAQL